MKLESNKKFPSKTLFRRFANRRQRGVAIVTVLAVIVLMATLVLSFFAMAKHEQTASKINADLLRNYGLRDIALNFAIGQIRNATTWKDASEPSKFTLWTSQPGMIRTFKNDGQPGMIFKLYSSDRMVIPGITATSEMKAQDLFKAWDTQPQVWVDLNKPIYKPSADPKDGVTAATRKGDKIYPIIHPDVYNGDEQNPDTPEGLSYTGGVVAGVEPREGKLAMPVKWLYLLQDGTIGTVNASGTFKSTGGVEASLDNPIVGRFAFWTDDESCKININTASEGVYWDSPRASTGEDHFYGKVQPANGEFQRFGGHPATVSLSSVLFPGKRFYPKSSGFAIQPKTVNGALKPMKGSEINFIWDMSPNIARKGGTIDGVAGSESLVRVPLNDTRSIVDVTIKENEDDRIFSSVDEMLFRGFNTMQRTSSTGTPIMERALWTDETEGYSAPFNSETFLKRVRNGQFTLTAKSSAPEVNIFGHPRISLWPVNKAVPDEFGNAATSQKVTKFDFTVALASMLLKTDTKGTPSNSQRNFYFLVRDNPSSRHNELEVSDARVRTYDLFRYLKNATGDHPSASKFPGILAANSFREKYRMISSLPNSNIPDYSDRDAFLAQMIDYMRLTNLSDPELEITNRYSTPKNSGGLLPANGQSTNFCFCGYPNRNGPSAHADTGYWSNAEVPRPKGFGRAFTPTEIVFLLQRLGTRSGGAANYAGVETWQVPGDGPITLRNIAPEEPRLEIYELAVMVEGFSPGHGWAGITPNMGATLWMGTPPKGAPASTPASFQVQGGPRSNPNVTLATVGYTGSLADETGYGPLDQYPRSGGFAGFRPFSNSLGTVYPNLIFFRPFGVVPGTGADPGKIRFLNSSGQHLQLVITDADGSATRMAPGEGRGNSLQCFYFWLGTDMAFPRPNGDGNAIFSERLKKTWRKRMDEGAWDTFLTNTVSRSLIIPHGDFRVSGAQRTLGRGVSPKKGGTVEFWNSFVPHPEWTDTNNSPHLSFMYEPSVGILRPPGYTGIYQGSNILSQLSQVHATPTLEPQYRGETVFPYRDRGGLPGYRSFLAPQPQLGEIETERGPADPWFTGDWDTGYGELPDGPYINRNDEGDLRAHVFNQPSEIPYFEALNRDTTPPKSRVDMAAGFAPSKMVKGPVQFGSLVTGANSNWPWQTLLFRPDPNGGVGMDPQTDGHFGGARRDHAKLSPQQRMPKDHYLLDFFWMPIVEPYAISDTFATKGKINMNYEIWPFTYIERSTALHALFKSERITAIPDADVAVYKKRNNAQGGASYRHYIDAKQTLKQFKRRFEGILEWEGDRSRVFKTPSEICELWLIPEGVNYGNEDPKVYTDQDAYKNFKTGFWDKHRLTGDNLKEAPYANLYPRLTTKSNIYKVFLIAQTIQKARSSDPKNFDADKDTISSEYRGSAVIERALDLTDPELKENDFFSAQSNQVFTNPRKTLDFYYEYRITELKQFAP